MSFIVSLPGTPLRRCWPQLRLLASCRHHVRHASTGTAQARDSKAHGEKKEAATGEKRERERQQRRLPCVIMRAGTSKGLFLHSRDLPLAPEKREKLLLRLFGSPDPRQIDGLGGADPLTSKVAIIGPPSRADADVDYTFAQIGIDKPVVDFHGNCGNISAGIAGFALEEGLLSSSLLSPSSLSLRIHQTNTQCILKAEIEVKEGEAAVEGECAIDGVPGTGSRVKLDFADTAGAVSGSLLPTGCPSETWTVAKGEREEEKKSFRVSLVDAGTPTVFLEAKSLGLKGTEGPKDVAGNHTLHRWIERIRGEAAVQLGLVSSWDRAEKESPYLPFLALVSPRSCAPYETYTSPKRTVAREEVDILSRLFFMQQLHKAYPGTGAVCTGAAALIPGTIVHEMVHLRKGEGQGEREKIDGSRLSQTLRIGHPSGVMQVACQTQYSEEKGRWLLTQAEINRTARRLMEGSALLPHSLWES